jgi:hypothetical protein
MYEAKAAKRNRMQAAFLYFLFTAAVSIHVNNHCPATLFSTL